MNYASQKHFATVTWLRSMRAAVASVIVLICVFGQLQQLLAYDEAIRVSQVTVSLVREAELPARDAGTLFKIEIPEGHQVQKNDIVAVLENEEQSLNLKASELTLQVAALKADDQLPVQSATTHLRETQAAKTVKEVALKIAEAEAVSESAVSIASAETQLREHDLERAVNARSSFKGSISEAHIDRLKTAVEKGQLETQLAKEALAVQKMKPEAEQAALHQKIEEIARYQTLVDQEEKNRVIAGVNCQLQRNAVEMARLKLEQRNIRAPFDGFVAKLERNVGEWVELGAPVARIIDLKTLRAEGFLTAAEGSPDLVGREVEILIQSGGREIELNGRMTFVSQEVDPVNQKVRFWAEFDNSDLQVRPGMIASLVIQKY